ncbi:hypothetical protein SUGI_0971870 [Cryptomeria japonica]|uniref:CASP-like protein 1U1 n=1 Tax=Cryptomeria japonica TaxID=3369 RepID=UPI0024149F87|nr:CASP-like protein 1U1 [Cryptomeria japonica]GLJ46133.1 hypothetical protein SUGI_0971870 [Cryptomeria japonica]
MDVSMEKSKSRSGRKLEIVDFVLRFAAIAATLVAAIVMGRDKQTLDTPIGPIVAKYHYSPANVFFVIANAIACVYAVFAINNTTANIVYSRSPAFSKLLRAFFDLIMVALLSASLGAAMGVGYIARKGNSHAFWSSICGLYGRFCHQGIISIASSLAATVLFVLLTTFSIYSLYKRSNS